MISINDPNTALPTLSPLFQDVLSLQYLDHDSDSGMGHHDAQRVIAFLSQHLTEGRNIAIHCFMGVSRSGAIAQFVSEHTPQHPMRQYQHANQRSLTLLRRLPFAWRGEAQVASHPYDTMARRYLCLDCGGLGHIDGETCPHCHDGYVGGGLILAP